MYNKLCTPSKTRTKEENIDPSIHLLINLNLYLTYKGERERNTVEVGCVYACTKVDRGQHGEGQGKGKYVRRSRVRGEEGKDSKYITHDGVEILTSKRREATR